jgi:[ribosomal protein S18]-alanine N-acetyltransferase
MIEVQNAAPVHLDDIINIANAGDLGHWTRADYEKELDNETAFLLVALQNKKTVGFVSARLITPVVEILNIAVEPGARKQRVGKKLLDAVLSGAKDRGASECWLEVRDSNETAQHFYQKNGFKVVGTRSNYYANPLENAVLMSLTL